MLAVLLGPVIGSLFAQTNPTGNQLGFAILQGRIETLESDRGQRILVDVPVNNFWVFPIQEFNVQVMIRDATGVVSQNATTTSLPIFSSRTIRITLLLDEKQVNRMMESEAVYIDSRLSFFYPEPLVHVSLNSTQRIR